MSTLSRGHRWESIRLSVKLIGATSQGIRQSTRPRRFRQRKLFREVLTGTWRRLSGIIAEGAGVEVVTEGSSRRKQRHAFMPDLRPFHVRPPGTPSAVHPRRDRNNAGMGRRRRTIATVPAPATPLLAQLDRRGVNERIGRIPMYQILTKRVFHWLFLNPSEWVQQYFRIFIIRLKRCTARWEHRPGRIYHHDGQRSPWVSAIESLLQSSTHPLRLGLFCAN